MNPEYFGLQFQNQIPRTILTSSPSSPQIAFHAFGIQEETNATFTITKFFSSKPMDNMVLNSMYSKIDVIYTHEWKTPGSYPALRKVDNVSFIHDGLYFINGMEGWISTMETQSISARNIALHTIKLLEK